MRVMLKLVRLEWKQNDIKKYIRILILLGLGSILISGIILTGKSKVDPIWILNNSFFVYMSVLFAVVVIDKCQGKIAERICAYPIQRYKLLLAKVLSVWGIMAPIWFLARLLAEKTFYFCGQIGIIALIENYNICIIFFNTIFWINCCTFSLFIGVLLKSSKAGVSSSIGILFIMQRLKIAEAPLYYHLWSCFWSTLIAIILLMILIQVIEKRDI